MPGNTILIPIVQDCQTSFLLCEIVGLRDSLCSLFWPVDIPARISRVQFGSVKKSNMENVRILRVPIMIYDKISWFPNPGWFTIVLHASRFLANLATSPNAIDFAFHKSIWYHFVFSLRLNCDQVHAIFLASFSSLFPRFLRFYGVSLASKCSPWKPITFSTITNQGARNS